MNLNEKFTRLCHLIEQAEASETMTEASVLACELHSEVAAFQFATTGAGRIAAERQRQIAVEGFSPEHDDAYVGAELVYAARSYLGAAKFCSYGSAAFQDLDDRPFLIWPWPKEWWKPSPDPIRNLEKAGALIAAEIDRLQRAKEVQHD